MKKTLPSLLLGSLLLSAVPTVAVHAATPEALGLTINNKIVHFETMPIQQNGRVLVPLRAICEAIGATVEWDANTQTASITRDHDKIEMTLGSTTAHKNDVAVTLDVPPQLIDEATMIPVRFLIEGFGLQAKWDEKTLTVSIDTLTATPSLPPANNQPALSIKEIAKNFDRVVMINIYDKKGKLLGSGSGMVVSEDGKILTNHHVLAEATTAKVVFQDQTMFTANKVLLDDPDRDLALMQINVSNLTTVKFGNSDQLEIGDNVVAIGSPLGMQNTLSAGLVSGLHRKIPVSKTKDVEFLQTNAPYTFGSSGGALFNMRGDVIGVTSEGAAYMGGELNFAIPSNDVTTFLKQPATPMSFPEYEKYVEEQQQKEMEAWEKDHPTSADDEDDSDYEAAYTKADEINNKIKKNHPDITAPGSDEKLKVSFSTYPSSDGYSQDLSVTVNDYSVVDDKGNLNRDAIQNLLLQFTRYAHEAGAVNPLVRLRMNFDTPTFSNQIHEDYQVYIPRNGKVRVSGYEAGWAMLEDATGTIVYNVNPDLDHTKQFARLN